jgi:hypothetical protein
MRKMLRVLRGCLEIIEIEERVDIWLDWGPKVGGVMLIGQPAYVMWMRPLVV